MSGSLLPQLSRPRQNSFERTETGDVDVGSLACGLPSVDLRLVLNLL